MEGGMSHTEEMSPTAKLRFVKKGAKLVLQQWWSNKDAVKMGPVNMVKGEWRDVAVEEEDE
jgi:hypothetical protein